MLRGLRELSLLLQLLRGRKQSSTKKIKTKQQEKTHNFRFMISWSATITAAAAVYIVVLHVKWISSHCYQEVLQFLM